MSIAVGGGDEETPMNDIKARSANINADPKMKELKHYMGSHQHEMRLRESVELEKRPASAPRSTTLRGEGTADMEDRLKGLSKQEAAVPYVMKTGELPSEFRGRNLDMKAGDLKDSMETRLRMIRRMDSWRTRLTWRDEMDQSLKRLLIDLELSRDERRKEYEPKKNKDGSEKKDETTSLADELRKSRFARARCDHLDKIFNWYEVHGMKEARKEKPAPPYLRFKPDDQVMPGSMRVATQFLMNKTNKPNEGGLSSSSSSPALIAAGSSAVASPAGGGPGDGP